jgi:hypothetical protein
MPTVNNATFLSTVFGEDKLRAFVTGFKQDPSGDYDRAEKGKMWGGGEVRNGGGTKIKNAVAKGLNTFVTISVFEVGDDGRARRTKDLHSKTYLVVADDISAGAEPGPGSKWANNGILDLVYGLKPSYILETSPGNTQWGWILSTGEERRWLIERIQDRMIELGLAKDAKDPGMRGVTRYVRLPEGFNTKSKYLNHDQCDPERGFPCTMLEWNPEVRYTAEEIASALDVDMSEPEEPARQLALTHANINPEDDPVLAALESEGMIKSALPGKRGGWDITCPWVDEHSGGVDDGTAYFAAGYVDRSTGQQYERGGFACHHGHCEGRSRRDLVDWLAQQGYDIAEEMYEFEEVIEEQTASRKAEANVIWSEELEQCTTEEELRRVCSQIRRSKHLDRAGRDVLASIVKRLSSELMGAQIGIAAARELVTPRRNDPSTGNANGREQRGNTPAWAQGWVFLCRHNEWFHVETKARYKSSAFDFKMAHHLGEDEFSASHFLARENAVPKIHDTLYAPGADALFVQASDGLEYANTYAPPPPFKAPEDWSLEEIEAIGVIEKHWEELIQDDYERSLLLDYLAWVAQNEDKRALWSPVIVGTTGDGKSVWHEIMELTIGASNVDLINGTTLDGRFNGYAEGHRLKVVEEMKMQGHNRFDRFNALKPNITNKRISVERKGQDPYTIPNTASYVVLTNYIDGLPIEKDERRFCLIRMRFAHLTDLTDWLESQEGGARGYWDRFYDAIRKHPEAVAGWLRTRKISPGFNPHGTAPETVTKTIARDLTLSEDESVMIDLINEGRVGISEEYISLHHMISALEQKTNKEVNSQWAKKLLIKNGWNPVTVVTGGDEVAKDQRIRWPNWETKTRVYCRAQRVQLTETEVRELLSEAFPEGVVDEV